MENGKCNYVLVEIFLCFVFNSYFVTRIEANAYKSANWQKIDEYSYANCGKYTYKMRMVVVTLARTHCRDQMKNCEDRTIDIAAREKIHNVTNVMRMDVDTQAVVGSMFTMGASRKYISPIAIARGKMAIAHRNTRGILSV